jgi:hypothetical protein
MTPAEGSALCTPWTSPSERQHPLIRCAAGNPLWGVAGNEKGGP